MASPRFKEIDLTKAQNTAAGLENKLDSSSSAFSSAMPSSKDLANQIALTGTKNRIAQLQSQRQKEKWYGTAKNADVPTGTQNEGTFSKVLNVLQAPLRAEVGAVKSVLGMSEGKGIIESADQNMNVDKQTYGDLLAKKNVPGAGFLGFGLDVLGDPLGWATMGTTSLIPRVTYGAGKGLAKEGLMGAAKAVGTGALSSLGEDTLNIAKWIPGVRKTEAFGKASEAVFNAGLKYDAIAGTDQIKDAGLGIIHMLDSRTGVTVGGGLEAAIKKIPGGETIIKKMKYSPADHSKEAQRLDALFKIVEDGGASSNVPVSLERIDEMIKSNSKLGTIPTVEKEVDHLNKFGQQIVDDVIEAENIAKTGNRSSFLMAEGSTEFEAAMAQEALTDQKYKDTLNYFLKLNRDKTGIESYDKLAHSMADSVSKFKIGNVSLGKNILTTIDGMSSMFKSFKISLNPASHVNAHASNVFFGAMKGFDMFDTIMGDGGASFRQVRNFYKGKEGADFLLKNIFNEFSDISRYAASNPGEFTRTYALNISDLGGKYFIDKLVKYSKDTGKLLNASDEKALRIAAAEAPDLIRSILEDVVDIEKNGGTMRTALSDSLKANKTFKVPSSVGKMSEDIINNKYSPAQKGYSMLSNELGDNIGTYAKVKENLSIAAELNAKDFQLYRELQRELGMLAPQEVANPESLRMFNELKAKAKLKLGEGSLLNKSLDGLLNKAVDFAGDEFELADRVFKTTTALKMANRGITESELRIISRSTKGGITEADIIGGLEKGAIKGVAGEKRYRIKFSKATEVVNDTFMNYAAMPPIVRFIRSVPIIGAPFASFTYGVIPKIGSTMVNNPAAFNKINFALHEAAGAKTPIEKEDINNPYYSWFSSPGMVKLPIMQNYPIYMNMSNWIPYYGMNLFTPSDKKYAETIPGELQALIDKTGLFGTPTGRLIWDYFIQPLITEPGEVPQNMFGQPTAPLNATALEKVGYAARGFAEGYVPTAAAPLGAIVGTVAPGLNQALPGYRMRAFAEGMGDKNQQGILKDQVPTLANVAETQLFNTASFMGVPLTPRDLKNIAPAVKKKIKK